MSISLSFNIKSITGIKDENKISLINGSWEGGQTTWHRIRGRYLGQEKTKWKILKKESCLGTSQRTENRDEEN